MNATSARTGGGITVLRNLFPALLAADEGRHTYVVAARREVWPQLDPGSPRVQLLTSSLAAHGVLGRVAWEQIEFPLRSELESADVVLSPANVIVPLVRKPQVLIFQNMAPHDENVLARYHGRGRLRFEILRRLGIYSGRRASRVIFISESARNAIGRQLGRDPSAMETLYLGRDESFGPEARRNLSAPELSRLGVRGPYLLTVSHFYRYKNFVELVRGFHRALPRLPADLQLLIAGKDHEPEYAAEVRATIRELGLRGRTEILGDVGYKDLPTLYASAEMFLFPSTCENFPNILVEGLSSAIPVLCAGVPPMTEIAADAAAYFDPFDPQDIAQVITRVWSSQDERETLSSRGPSRARMFSWAETGRGVLRALETAARR